MHDYFGEDVAARYDETSAERVRPGRARSDRRLPRARWRARGRRSSSRSAPGGSRSRSRRAACRSTASSSRRRWPRDCGPSRAARRSRVTIGDFATHPRRRDVPARLPRLQHDRQPDDPGPAGRVLPQRRRAPGAGRDVRDRGRHARTCSGCRRGRRSIPFHVCDERIGFDEYDVANQGLISHHLEIASDGRAIRNSIPFRYVVAGRVRPDGAARGDDAARALERLAPRAVHEREPQTRVGLGQGRHSRASDRAGADGGRAVHACAGRRGQRGRRPRVPRGGLSDGRAARRRTSPPPAR